MIAVFKKNHDKEIDCVLSRHLEDLPKEWVIVLYKFDKMGCVKYNY